MKERIISKVLFDKAAYGFTLISTLLLCISLLIVLTNGGCGAKDVARESNAGSSVLAMRGLCTRKEMPLTVGLPYDLTQSALGS